MNCYTKLLKHINKALWGQPFFIYLIETTGTDSANNPPKLVCPDSGQVIYAERLQTGAYHSWPDPTATDDEDGSIPRYVIIIFHGAVF